MSKPIHAPRAPRRALALVTAALLAATGLSTVPAASAAGDGDTLQPVQARDTGLRSGRYVVLMKAPSATQYDGSDPRYAATRMVPGGSFDGRSRQVQSYSRHLVSEHDALARSVGADVLRHYTVGSNGFVADLTGKQAFQLSSDRDVLLVSPDVARQADTWNTPSFLGLEGKNGVWAQRAGGRANAGDGVVVGVIDSGIWPESKSFSGGKLTKSPKTKWKITRVGAERADAEGRRQRLPGPVPAQPPDRGRVSQGQEVERLGLQHQADRRALLPQHLPRDGGPLRPLARRGPVDA